MSDPHIPKTLFGFLWHFIKMQPQAYMVMAITAIIWSANESIFPYLVKLIINGIVSLE